jgi:hypothetical protein
MLTAAFIGLQAALAERPKRLGGLHGSPQQRRPRRYRHEGRYSINTKADTVSTRRPRQYRREDLVCLLGKGPVGSLKGESDIRLAKCRRGEKGLNC